MPNVIRWIGGVISVILFAIFIGNVVARLIENWLNLGTDTLHGWIWGVGLACFVALLLTDGIARYVKYNYIRLTPLLCLITAGLVDLYVAWRFSFLPVVKSGWDLGVLNLGLGIFATILLFISWLVIFWVSKNPPPSQEQIVSPQTQPSGTSGRTAEDEVRSNRRKASTTSNRRRQQNKRRMNS